MKVKELQKVLLNNKGRKQIKFIKKEFYNLDNSNLSKLRNNIDTLKKIDDDILNYIIAKLESQKSYYDSMSVTLVIFTVLITIGISMIEIISNFYGLSLEMLFFFIIIVLIAALLNTIISSEQRRNKVIVFFISLLKEIKNSK